MNQRNKTPFLIGVLCLAFLFVTSCGKDGKDVPDVSDIPVEFELYRTEKAIAEVDTNVTNIMDQLYDVDSNFYSIFFERVLQVPISRMSVEEKDSFIKGFIRDDRIQGILSAVDSVYGDFREMEDLLAESFQYGKHYFPRMNTPNIYTFISEYSHQRFIFDDGPTDGIALGLDMFLGEDYPYASYVPNNTAFSSYLTRRFSKDYIVRNTAETIAEDWLGVSSKRQTMLDKMLFNGKKLYIISRFIPGAEDHIVMGYTPEQMKWCEDNQQEMWAYFFKEELFYSTDINKISKLVEESPHSTGMPPAAPGRTGNYMGWKIIEAFMSRNDYEAEEILSLDALTGQKILEMSKFKPKRK